MDDPGNQAPQDLRRFRLAPGLRVVRRGRHHLQVGLYDGRRALLPRTPEVETVLAALTEGLPLQPGSVTTEVLSVLRERGCVVTLDERSRGERRRRRARVAVVGDLPGAADLLAGAGVRLVGAGQEAEVALVGGVGELDRGLLDPLIRTGTAHIVVRLVDGAALVGPFVVPGLTACLRCVDGHQSVGDPDHVPVTSRYVRATARPRSDGLPDVEPILAGLAAAWAVHDVVAHLDGRRPATWSRTVLLDPDPSLRREQDWSRHPECGCCWSAADLPSGTMGT